MCLPPLWTKRRILQGRIQTRLFTEKVAIMLLDRMPNQRINVGESGVQEDFQLHLVGPCKSDQTASLHLSAGVMLLRPR
jgi:hypothetical protein